MDPELVLLLPAAELVLSPFSCPVAARPAPEPIGSVNATLAALLLPVPAPVPQLPLLSALLFAAWWLSLSEVGCLRALAVPLCRALPRVDWVDILRHNFLCSPMVLVRHLTCTYGIRRYRRAPKTPVALRDMFMGLDVILGYFPACCEAQALLVAIQLCAHCLALTVLAATVCSFDPAPHLRRRMREALQVTSIRGRYARPRDYYAALFAPDASLDDESYTAAGCTVRLTQGFFRSPLPPSVTALACHHAPACAPSS